MELIKNTLLSLAYIITQPSLIIMLILLGIVFYFKNRKLSLMQKVVIGETITSPLELTLSQIVLGILGGILASIIFSILGITFTETSGIQFLFLLSIILMFIKSRFVCFSYSATVLGAISLLSSLICSFRDINQTIFDIDILCLITFVGVMHIIEGFLVMFDGDKGSIPVFTKRNNQIIGGYALSRYWIMPIAIFIAFNMSDYKDIVTSAIETPTFWPLLNTEYLGGIIKTSILVSMPFWSVIGYSTITFTRDKYEKKYSSGLYIIVFGVLLTIIAQISRIGIVGEIIVLLITPLGHELMLFLQRKFEESRNPIFLSNEDGISILEIVPYSEIYNLKVRPGDKIVNINGEKVDTEKEVYEKAKRYRDNLQLDILSRNGVLRNITLKEKNNKGLMVVLVPREVDKDKVVPVEEKSFSEILHNIDKDKTE